MKLDSMLLPTFWLGETGSWPPAEAEIRSKSELRTTRSTAHFSRFGRIASHLLSPGSLVLRSGRHPKRVSTLLRQISSCQWADGWQASALLVVVPDGREPISPLPHKARRC